MQFWNTLELDLDTVEPSLCRPSPAATSGAAHAREGVVRGALGDLQKRTEEIPAPAAAGLTGGTAVAEAVRTQLEHGLVVIAAITKLHQHVESERDDRRGTARTKRGRAWLRTKPWVKTSLAPGSKVVTDILVRAGLQAPLDALGFNLVGYGCTTCIGNSGPLPDEIAAEVRDRHLVVCSVLSGNRNFEGRIDRDVRANDPASPPLVVGRRACGLARRLDPTTEPLGIGQDGRPVFLKDLWPASSRFMHHAGLRFRGDVPPA